MAGNVTQITVDARSPAGVPEPLSAWQLGDHLLRELQLGGAWPCHDVVFFDNDEGEPVGGNFFSENFLRLWPEARVA